MPGGDFKNMDPKLTPPPRAELNRSMEAVIHHFKLVTQGYTVPAGEATSGRVARAASLAVYVGLRRRHLAVSLPRARPVVREPSVAAPMVVRAASSRT